LFFIYHPDLIAFILNHTRKEKIKKHHKNFKTMANTVIHFIPLLVILILITEVKQKTHGIKK